MGCGAVVCDLDVDVGFCAVNGPEWKDGVDVMCGCGNWEAVVVETLDGRGK